MRDLDEISVSEWTEDESYQHLSDTFNRNCREFPYLMEPYMICVEETDNKDEQKALMQSALRETISQRYPL